MFFNFMCVHCMQVHLHVCGGGQRSMLDVFFISTVAFFRQAFHWTWSMLMWLDWLHSKSQSGPPFFCLTNAGLQICATAVLGSLMGSWRPNSGPYACLASTLLMQPALQPPKPFKLWKISKHSRKRDIIIPLLRSTILFYSLWLFSLLLNLYFM